MRCSRCGYDNLPDGAPSCPRCAAPVRQPAAPETVINAQQQIGRQTGGKATVFEADKVAGNVTVALQAYNTPARSARPHVPPGARGDFVGRAQLLGQVVASLRGRQTTLLHGTAGVGKTALAAAAVKVLHAERAFENGVLWVSDIGPAPVGAVCDAIARQLGDDSIPQLAAASKPDAVRELLAERGNLLLVLDHFQREDTARVFCESCLPERFALLATSRARHTVFDADFAVGPLQREDALAVFARRAKLTAADGVAAEICRLLGDHPLALVIVAGRIRAEAIPPSSLRDRLADKKNRLRTLVLGGGADRSQSVRVSLQLSYDDLRPEQQRAFTHLAACFGRTTGIGLLAEVLGVAEADCEDAVGRLVAQSLVERDGPRVGLALLVADFGRDALGDGLTAAQDRIAEVMSAFAARHGGATPGDYNRLEAELGNLLGALRHAARRGLWATALRLANPLSLPTSGVLAVRGYWDDLVAAGHVGMKAAEKSGDEQGLAWLEIRTAIALQRRGKYRPARVLYERARDRSAKLRDQANVARALHNLGMLAHNRGEYAEALRFYQDSLNIKKAPPGDKVGAARTLHELGRLAQHRGDFAEAGRFFEESLALKRQLRDEAGIATTLYNLGHIALEQGDHELARRRYADSQLIFTRRGDSLGLAILDHHLGRLAHDQGNYDEARRLYVRALEVFRKLRAPAYAAGALHDLGRLAREQGDRAQSRSCLEESLAMRQALGDRAGVAANFQELGALAREEGKADEARKLLGDSLSICGQLPDLAGVARGQHELGRLAYEQGDRPGAGQLLRQSLELSQRLGIQEEVARNLLQLGHLARDEGNTAEATDCYRQALRLFGARHCPQVEAARQDLARLEGQENNAPPGAQPSPAKTGD